MRGLSDLSGRGLSTLGDWSANDEWVEQRERFWNERRTLTDQKINQKISDQDSDEWAIIAADHYATYQSLKEHAQQLLRTITDAEPMNLLSLAIDRCIKGQREAKGMKFHSLDAAMEAVRRAGFEVIEREYLRELLAAQEPGEDYSSAGGSEP
jgi:hypothetical protein